MYKINGGVVEGVLEYLRQQRQDYIIHTALQLALLRAKKQYK